MEELLKLWFPKYEKRHNWRNKALNKYIESLNDNEVKEIIRSSLSGVVPVSLYGKSQVGKTTFLLKLLDIKEDYLEKIHDILRCGSAEGQAATPTAMIYKKTQQCFFRIKYTTHKLECDSENEIREELINLRKKVENQELEQLDEIIIEIPEKYFNNNYDINIQICDLPGVESSNEREKAHVEKIIKKFIPLSALILVFQEGQAVNGVHDLFDNGLLSEVYGWKYMAERYRLILTRAYSAKTVVYEINCGQLSLDKQEIKKFYRSQANNSPLKPDNVPDKVNLFPLEFGKSFNEDLPVIYKPEVLEKINFVMNEYWKEIREDIKITAETGNVVQRLSVIPNLLKKIISEEQDNKNKLIEERKKENEESEKTIASFKIGIEKKEQRIEEINEKIQRYKEIGLLSDFSEYSKGLNKKRLLNFIEQITDDFRKQINEINDQIRISEKGNWIDETYWHFYEIRSEIDSIWFEEPKLWIIGGPDRKHVDILNNKINKLNNRVNSKYNPIIETKISEEKCELKSEKKILKNQIVSNNSAIEELTKKKLDSDKNKELRISEYTEKIKRFNKEFNQEENILDLMRNEIKHEKDTIQNKLKNQSSIEAFLDLLYILLIIKEFEKQKIII